MKKLNKTRGFTLVELLVVIAIIALLVSITLPILGKARHRGRQASSLGNAGQIMKGIMMYTLDNRNRLPGWDVSFGVSEIADDKDTNSKTDSPIDYIGDPKVFQSPADRGSSMSGMSHAINCYQGDGTDGFGTSYAYASTGVRAIESIDAASGGSYRITQITNSSSKVVVFEPIIGTSQADPQDNWYGGRNGSSGGVAGFQDGHAEVIKPGQTGYY